MSLTINHTKRTQYTTQAKRETFTKLQVGGSLYKEEDFFKEKGVRRRDPPACN